MAALTQRGRDFPAGNVSEHARPAVRLATGSVILSGLASLLFLLSGSGAPCGPGRVCVPSAGLSVALPAGWTVTASSDDRDILRAASPSPSVGISMSRGDSTLGGGPYRTLDDVATAVAAEYAGGTAFPFGGIVESVVDLQTLPIGPAVRVRTTTSQNFIMNFNQSSSMYWFFADSRLVELEYDEAVGENDPALLPQVETNEMRTVLESLRPMTAAMGAADSLARPIPWLLASSLSLLGVTVVVVLRHARISRRDRANRTQAGDFWDGSVWR